MGEKRILSSLTGLTLGYNGFNFTFKSHFYVMTDLFYHKLFKDLKSRKKWIRKTGFLYNLNSHSVDQSDSFKRCLSDVLLKLFTGLPSNKQNNK